MYATTVEFSYLTNTWLPFSQGRKCFSNRWTASISRQFMWLEHICGPHLSAQTIRQKSTETTFLTESVIKVMPWIKELSLVTSTCLRITALTLKISEDRKAFTRRKIKLSALNKMQITNETGQTQTQDSGDQIWWVYLQCSWKENYLQHLQAGINPQSLFSSSLERKPNRNRIVSTALSHINRSHWGKTPGLLHRGGHTYVVVVQTGNRLTDQRRFHSVVGSMLWWRPKVCSQHK